MTRTRSRSIGLTAIACAAALAAVVPAPGAEAGAPLASCATSQLVVWLDTQSDAAAGSVFYRLKLTNLSSHACTVFGYPGVSAVDLAGRQIGRAASRNPAQERTVSLAHGATATATLRIVQALNFPTPPAGG